MHPVTSHLARPHCLRQDLNLKITERHAHVADDHVNGDVVEIDTEPVQREFTLVHVPCIGKIESAEAKHEVLMRN